jgi:hypothetical protein
MSMRVYRFRWLCWLGFHRWSWELVFPPGAAGRYARCCLYCPAEHRDDA